MPATATTGKVSTSKVNPANLYATQSTSSPKVGLAAAEPGAAAGKAADDGPPTCPQRMRTIFASLRFAFIALVTSALVIASVLSWRLTYNAAQESLNLVTADYSSVVVLGIAAQIDLRLAAAEHLTLINKDYFALGVLEMGSPLMYNMFRVQMRELITDTASALAVTSTTGQLSSVAWNFVDNEPSSMVYINTTGQHVTQYEMNAQTGALGALVFDRTGVDFTGAPWVRMVNMSDPTSSPWTLPYSLLGYWAVTTARPLYNITGDPIGVIQADIQLGFIDTVAKDLASTSSVGTQFLILDAASGIILGSSLNLTLTTASAGMGMGPSQGVYLNTTTAELLALYDFIVEKSGRSPLSGTLYLDLPELSGEVHISGQRILLTVYPFTYGTDSENMVQWLLIHGLDRSTVQSKIDASNQRVLISVLCICISFIAVTSALIFYAARLIGNLSGILTSFARFEFRAHVQGGQLKSRSFFAELRDMQNAVLLMTRAFKHHLDNKNAYFGGGPIPRNNSSLAQPSSLGTSNPSPLSPKSPQPPESPQSPVSPAAATAGAGSSIAGTVTVSGLTSATGSGSFGIAMNNIGGGGGGVRTAVAPSASLVMEDAAPWSPASSSRARGHSPPQARTLAPSSSMRSALVPAPVTLPSNGSAVITHHGAQVPIPSLPLELVTLPGGTADN